MPKSKATTVAEYIAALPEDKRAVVEGMRKFIRRHLPRGYDETISWGVISYEVPLARHSNTYNGRPLTYVALAAQKNYCSLHLLRTYGDPKQASFLKEEFKKAGKKLDMGKGCLRFRSLDDLPLEALGQVIKSTTPEKWIEISESTRKK